MQQIIIILTLKKKNMNARRRKTSICSRNFYSNYSKPTGKNEYFILSHKESRASILDWFICSDEAYFYVHGGHNIQNNRIWAEFNPDELFEQPQVMVWCDFSSKKVYGYYFFSKTVKWTNCLLMLKNFLTFESKR